MKLMKFVRAAAPYNANDVAGFGDDEAYALYRAGHAVYENADDIPPEPVIAEDPEGVQPVEVEAPPVEPDAVEQGADDGETKPAPEGKTK